ncbi:MAG: D-glycero-beta-D-manno-heptose 1,7-bisphosphate 7-phosphatase [Pseudomonadota bacterium]
MSENSKPLTYTVFLDRDGVINRDSPDYIKHRDEFHFIPGSCEAIALLTRAGCDVIVITNQSAVGRNMTTPAELDRIFEKMRVGVTAAGGVIKAVFFCPHTPEDGCSCRKPKPGLILQAARQYAIDLKHSCMVGDSARDLECGARAGCGAIILVQPDISPETAKAMDLKRRGIDPDHVALDLMDATLWILKTVNSAPGKP